jgi:hypothetical protein
MNYLGLVAPVVAGFFALLGAWLGTRASRANEHEKWLRQARTEAFAKFLRTLHTCEDVVYADKRKDHGDICFEVWVGRQLQPAYNEGRVVRLFLPPEKRELVFKYLSMIEGGHFEAKFMPQRHEGVEKLQNLLEEHLARRS